MRSIMTLLQIECQTACILACPL